MSRIIVKQLPKNISEAKLRNLFASKGGTITDLQLKYTPDGKFRQFCFIGYRSGEEAEDAIKYFNNTCIQTSRIKVELCAALGADDKPASWSKYAKDKKKSTTSDSASTAETESKDLKNEKNKKEKVSKCDEIIGKHKDDPEFQEFMKVHDRTRTLWANDADMVASKAQEEVAESESEVEVEDDKDRIKNNNIKEDENDMENESEADSESNEKLAEKPISDLEYMKSLMTTNKTKETSITPVKSDKTTKGSIDLFTIKIHNVPYNTKRQEILKFFKPLKPYSVRLPTNVHGFCYVGFKTEKDMNKAMLKNKSFIKGKQVFFSDFTEKNKISKSKLSDKNHEMSNDNTAATIGNAKWAKQAASLSNEENISDSGRIFFRNLAYTVTEDDMQKLFEQFGPIAEVNLPVDALTRQIKGFGTVTFMMPEHALQAFNKLDGTDFNGRLLHLIPAKSRDEEKDLDENDALLTFKQKKALKLKKNAQQSATWNTLFLGANTVAEIIAKRFQMSKEKVLDANEGGSSAAVRIALGETQIVIEMKKFLEENGVCLNAFDLLKGKRSKTIILAKNLPADTAVSDLIPIFSKFGPIGRIVLPPSGVTALIEFCDPSEAKKAFKKLAYSKFKNVPLYLEWAPENTFTTTLNGEQIIAKEVKNEEVPNANEPDSTVNAENDNDKMTSNNSYGDADNADDADDLANEPPEPCTTLFLRNLNFKTVLDTVYAHFKPLGAIHTVEIAKRKDAQNPRNMVSMGYGFIQFKKSATAEKALKRMQFTTIDGNEVELKRSDRILKTATNTTQQRKPAANDKQTGTKLLVRNIPFQAKTKEVRDIFKAFGELRSVRLPTKATPGEDSHRGFGFVDFITKSDAKKAFEALSQSTHLYGRRLVLEWASITDDDVEEIRKRTAAHFNTGSVHKQSKKSVFDVDGKMQSTADADNDEMDV